MSNFLSLRLGDNDFGNELRLAMAALVGCHGLPAMRELNPHTLQPAMVRLVDALCDLGTRDVRESVYRSHINYLTEHLRVVVSECAPDWDTDHGTVSIDLNSGYVWSH